MDKKPNVNELLNKLQYSDPLSEFEFESSLDILAQYLLFGTKWETTILKGLARRKIPILGDLPLVCQADDCPYATKCPILRNITKSADKLKLVGTDCRADRIYALEEFTSFIKELQIDPEQTTDILNVARLVRILLLKRRIDWTLSIEGVMRKEPGIIDQRTGQIYHKDVVHPLLKVMESLEKQVAVIQKQLMSDRQARAALVASLGRGSDVLKDLFSGNLGLLEDNPIDAEFTQNDEEKEE